MTLENWMLFSSIALVATLSPGPAVLLVTTHTMQYGPVRSICTILGNVTGLFLMSLCSVLGLSTVIMYSMTAFTIIKSAGALYLIYLGIKLWRNGIGKPQAVLGGESKGASLVLYGQGIMVALTNPKAIAFTTALFPQFVVNSQPLGSQFFILVATFMTLSFLCLAGYSLLSHSAKNNVQPLVSRKTSGRVFGGIFILSGAALATASNR